MGKQGENLAELRKILIRSPNWVGDAVMSLPALAALREAIPGGKICILAKPWVADIFPNSPYVDRLILYESPGIHQGLKGKIRLARKLKREDFDLAILFPNSFESALITYLAQIPRRAGYNTDGRSFLLTHVIKAGPQKKGHQIDYYLNLIKGLGFPGRWRLPFLTISAEELRNAQERLESFGIKNVENLVGINPGASFGPAKQWSAERFGQLSLLIGKKLGAQIIILGSEGDKETARQVKTLAGDLCTDLTGRTKLAEAMAIIKKLRLFITNDSGLMHIAAALNIPTVAIFGSTSPEYTGPQGDHCRVIKKYISCSPCFKQKCPQKMECLEAISVEEVYEEVEKMWNFAAADKEGER